VLGVEADFQKATFGGRGSYAGGMNETAGYRDRPADDGTDTLLVARQAIGGGTFSAGMDWIGTARGRLGYAIADTLLAYGTGGFAYGKAHASAIHLASSSIMGEEGFIAAPAAFGAAAYGGVRAGWSAGGGLEWMFADKWSARAEGLYYNLGTASLISSPMATLCPSPAGAEAVCARGAGGGSAIGPGGLLWASSPVAKVQFDGVMLRAGVNYHFDWGADVFN